LPICHKFVVLRESKGYGRRLYQAFSAQWRFWERDLKKSKKKESHLGDSPNHQGAST